MAKVSRVKAKSKTATTRSSPIQTKILNGKGYGSHEPVFKNNRIESQIDLIKALNWYNYMAEANQACKWLIEYASKLGSNAAKSAKSLNEKTINRTMAHLARLILRGITLPESEALKINAYLDSIKIEPRAQRTDTVHVEVDRIGEFIPDFEEAIDTYDPEFSTYNYLISNNVPQTYAMRIRDKYQPLLDEMNLALNKKDPQVVEAYSSLKKSEIIINAKYVLNIIDDCNRYLSNTKKVRSPRKPKKKTTEQLLKHFTYLKSNEELKLISINPESIIESSELFTINIAYNVMTRFVAKEGGLQIHRSSIINYDEDKTKSKRVGKKLQKCIDIVLNGSKVQRSSVLDTVKADYVKIADRINNNTILLKIVR